MESEFKTNHVYTCICQKKKTTKKKNCQRSTINVSLFVRITNAVFPQKEHIIVYIYTYMYM